MSNRAFNSERLYAAMDDLRIDAVLASSPWNVTYMSGLWLDVPLPTFLVTARDGRQGLVINEADAIFMRHDSRIGDIRDYRFSDTTTKAADLAIKHLADMLQDLGLSKAIIGIEQDFLPFAHWSTLNDLLPDGSLADGYSVFNEARIYKTQDEVEILRRAAHFTDKAINTGFALARPGDTEKDLANSIQSCILRFGAKDFSHTVCSAGIQSTVVHAHPLDKPIETGEVIHVDCGGRFEGYQTDLSRTAVVGDPSDKQQSIYEKLWHIEQLVFQNLKPGIVAREVFGLAEEEFEQAGLQYPWGTFGHSIGLLVHEGFEITRTSDRILEPGMVLNIEPSHIEQGDARYHIEDTVLITESGIEVLSDYYVPSEMYIVR